jgi:hypothetical protein
MRARQTGQLLVAAVVLIVVIGTMVIAVSFLNVGNTQSATASGQSAKALYAANAGLDYTAYRFRSDATAFATTCANLNNVTQPVVASISSFTLTTTNVGLANTNLTAAIATTTATTPISVTSTAGFPSHGRMRVDSEEMAYTGKTATTFTGLRRGAAGTTANTHLNNAPVGSEAQCVVRSTGTAGSGSRILESSILPGPRAQFLDGGSVGIGTIATPLGSLPTTLPAVPAGSANIVIAAIALQSINATATQIAAGNLILRNATTATTLGSNQFVVWVGGSGGANNIDRDSRPQKTHFIVARDLNAAANQTYDVRATGNNAFSSGAAQILVINSPRLADASGSSGTVIVTTGGVTIASRATTFTAGNNIVIASVQINNNSGNRGRFIGATNLALLRGATTLSSNQYQITLDRGNAGGNTNQEYGYLLVATDNGAPANQTYSVVGTASGNLDGEAKIVILQGPAGSFVPGADTLVGTTATTLATNTAATFPPLAAGAGVALIASIQYNVTGNAGPYSVASNAEREIYNSVTQTSNNFPYLICSPSNVDPICSHFEGGSLWLQTFAGGTGAPTRTGSSFLTQSSVNTANAVRGAVKSLAIHLEPVADRLEIFPP